MGQGNLDDFGAYRMAMELFDLVAQDLDRWLRQRKYDKLVSQQLGSADSVCANMEEDFGRESRKEYRRFLIISRGSLRETSGRYYRFRRWIPPEVIHERIALADQISCILTSTINTLGRSD